METFGDAGTPNENYDGAPTNPSPVSLDYYRNKVREFQETLNGIDAAYRAGAEIYSIASDEELGALLAEYESRKDSIRGVAETINLGASVINSMGGRMPVLSVPGTLGLAPFVLPAAAIAAIASAAYFVDWGRYWTQALATSTRNIALMMAESAPERARILELSQQAERTALETSASPAAALTTVVKWGAIAGAAFLAWKYWQSTRASNPVIEDDSGDDDED